MRTYFSGLSALALLACLLVVSACSSGGTDTTGLVRFIHAAPDAGVVDVFIRNRAVFETTSFRTVTPYDTTILAEELSFVVRNSTDASDVVLRFVLNVIPEQRQTVVLAGVRSQIAPIVLLDNVTATADSAQVRLVHAAALAGAVDLYLTAPSETPAAATYAAIRFRQNTGFFAVAPGTYRLVVTPAGDATVLLDETVALPMAPATTLVLAGANAGGALTLITADP